MIATPESVVVINHQPSRFGPESYVNVGLAYVALSLPAAMKEQFCHLRFRADLLLTADEQASVSAWITTKGKTDDQAVRKLLDFVSQFISIPAARARYHEDPTLFENMMIVRDLRTSLGS